MFIQYYMKYKRANIYIQLKKILSQLSNYAEC